MHHYTTPPPLQIYTQKLYTIVQGVFIILTHPVESILHPQRENTHILQFRLFVQYSSEMIKNEKNCQFYLFNF